jgi:hypothetical protein
VLWRGGCCRLVSLRTGWHRSSRCD